MFSIVVTYKLLLETDFCQVFLIGKPFAPCPHYCEIVTLTFESMDESLPGTHEQS